jgi:hypothetical protein
LSGKPLPLDEFIEDRRQYLNSIDLGVSGPSAIAEVRSVAALHAFPT